MADGTDGPAVDLLRDTLGLTGTKLVCGAGVCGACMVQVDGTPMVSCLLPCSALAGRSVTTVEGLGGSHPAQPAAASPTTSSPARRGTCGGSVRRWSEQSIILPVMQTLDNSLTVHGTRGRLGRYRLTSRQGHGEPNPTGIPAGNVAARHLAAMACRAAASRRSPTSRSPRTSSAAAPSVTRRRPV